MKSNILSEGLIWKIIIKFDKNKSNLLLEQDKINFNLVVKDMDVNGHDRLWIVFVN